MVQGGRDYPGLRLSTSYAGFTSNNDNFYQLFLVHTKRLSVDTYNTLQVGEVSLAKSFSDTTGYSLSYDFRSLAQISPNTTCSSYPGDQTGSKLVIKSKKIAKDSFGQTHIIVNMSVVCNLFDESGKLLGKVEGDMQFIYINTKQSYK